MTGREADGTPVGVAPDMVVAIAGRLCVPLTLVPFASPGAVADAVAADAWDIALIAFEPERAETIAFAPPYVEIEATYLMPAGSPIRAIAEVDRPGVRIAISARSAYGLYLSRNLSHAELCRAEGLPAPSRSSSSRGSTPWQGYVRPWIENADTLPGARVLDGRYSTVQQAVGTRPGNPTALDFLTNVVTEETQSGLVARLIERHGVTGRLMVAASA